ncbi:MAG: hypothetical protein CM15mP4_0670 [Candidatus Neomarinimicrobiota bacterium]|nr:MAG: hypothetical protein CM15mP4_0670 [Candidatus Neomarinimicrobiota bacterium]
MSVDNPQKTSTIVQEWLEQPAPAPAAKPAGRISNDEERERGKKQKMNKKGLIND